MKILHCITSLDKGGAETHLKDLVIAQKRSKDEILVVYSKGNSYWSKYIRKNGIKTIKLNKNKSTNLILIIVNIIREIIYLRKIIKNYKPHILHAHLPKMEIYCWFASLNLNLKLIVTKHLDNFFFDKLKKDKNIILKTLSYLFYIRFSKVIAISQSVKSYLIKNNFLNEKKISVIYYGYNFGNNRLKKNKIFTIGCASRLVPQKSLDILINSFAIFNKNFKHSSQLIIAGIGEEKYKLKKLAKELKITKKVKFLGFIKNIDNFYKKLNIFCLTSKFEGLGLVLLEALNNKVPIVTFNKSAMKEIIKNKVNGFLVNEIYNDNQQYKEFSKKFLYIYKNKFIPKTTDNFLKKFSYKNMIVKTKKVYVESLRQ